MSFILTSSFSKHKPIGCVLSWTVDWRFKRKCFPDAKRILFPSLQYSSRNAEEEFRWKILRSNVLFSLLRNPYKSTLSLCSSAHDLWIVILSLPILWCLLTNPLAEWFHWTETYRQCFTWGQFSFWFSCCIFKRKERCGSGIGWLFEYLIEYWTRVCNHSVHLKLFI